MKREDTKEKRKRRIREAIAVVITLGILCCSLIKPIEVKAYNSACSIPPPSTMLELCGDVPRGDDVGSWSSWINWYADLGYTYTGYQQCTVGYTSGTYTGWWLSLKDASGNPYWAILRESNGSYYGFYNHWVRVQESTGNVFYYTNGQSIIYRNTWIHVRTHNDYYSASAAHGYFALNDSGRMCTGWHKDTNGKWYYFRIDDTNHEDGACTKVGESTNGGLLWSTVKSATSANPWGQVTSEGLYCFEGVDVVTNVYRKNTSGNYVKVGTQTDRISAGDGSNQIKPFTRKTLSANTTYVNNQVYNKNGLWIDTSVNGSYTGSQNIYLKNDDYQQIKVNEFNYYINRKSFTLTQHINSDTATNASTNLYFEETKTIDNPTKTGYTFDGWSVSGTGSSLSGTTFKMGTSNATLTAKWKPNTYYVSYDKGLTNKGGTTSKTTHTYNADVTLNSNGFTGRSYSLAFNENKPKDDYGTVTAGDVTNLQDTKSGNLSFKNWHITDAHNNNGTYPSANTNLGKKNYRTDNGGTATATAQWNSKILNSFSSASLTGYKFNGYYTAASGGTKITSENVSPSTTAYNKTLYAQWTPITYTVRFNGNGHWNTSQVSYTQDYIYDKHTALTPNKFTRPDNTTYNSVNYIKGYEFIGWGKTDNQKTADYTDKQTVVNLTATDGAVIDLYALWKKPITLTFDFNGGKFNNDATPEVLEYTMYNSELNHTFGIAKYYGTLSGSDYNSKGLNNELTKTDSNGIQYRFLGYSLNKNATVPDANFDVYSLSRIESYNIRDNTTLYAVWEPVLQMTVQLSASNPATIKVPENIPVTTALGNFKILKGDTNLPSSGTASVKPATIGTNVTNKDSVTYTVSAKGASSIKFSTAADSRILDIYTHGKNNPWFDTLNEVTNFNYSIDDFTSTENSFKIPQYLGTTQSYKTSNPESATGTSVYAIKFTCTQPSYYYKNYWHSDESTSVYCILSLNATASGGTGGGTGGIGLPPYAVEDGMYDFQTILN